jgi:hypothetical protein
MKRSQRAAAILLLAPVPYCASAQVQAPYSGSPTAIPATWPAEDFDRGGEGLAYHDNVAGNAGGQYRAGEDVDIVVAPGSEGGAYVVNNFETGEWLEYTIDAPAAGLYELQLRVSNNEWSPAPAFRFAIDGRGDITAAISVPSTGSWDNFEWVAADPVYLEAGEQVLRVVALQQYFNVSSIRILDAPDPSPYSGVPSAIPGTWEAEDFDLGGQGAAYHDNVAGNSGGQYRPTEHVDIVASSDSEGADYAVNHFETGEWLAYTVDVASTGTYDIELRVSSQDWAPAPAFRLEIDGTEIPGPVDVPSTGSWEAFTWVKKPRVSLPAGRHVLKVVSERQYFDLNRIRVTPSASQPTTLLFRSGFENAVGMGAPTDCYGTGCWQPVSGTDFATGFTWPPQIWNGANGRSQLHADAEVEPPPVSRYIVNELQSEIVRGGARALYSEILESGCCGPTWQLGGPTQDPYVLEPYGLGAQRDPALEGDLYLSYWLRFQDNLEALMGEGDCSLNANIAYHWRVPFQWKTAGDYRVIFGVLRDRNPAPDTCDFTGPLYWAVGGDNDANWYLYDAPAGRCEPPLTRCVPQPTNVWGAENRSVPVPVGQWFKLEFFWHRSSGSGGRVWIAVDGQVVFDRYGPNTGEWDRPIDRIMITQLYSSTRYPIYQWVDDLQIWSGFPTAEPGDPWYDPPYATH